MPNFDNFKATLKQKKQTFVIKKLDISQYEFKCLFLSPYFEKILTEFREIRNKFKIPQFLKITKFTYTIVQQFDCQVK